MCVRVRVRAYACVRVRAYVYVCVRYCYSFIRHVSAELSLERYWRGSESQEVTARLISALRCAAMRAVLKFFINLKVQCHR